MPDQRQIDGIGAATAGLYMVSTNEELMRIEEVRIPTPGPGEILIKVIDAVTRIGHRRRAARRR
jgi:hypothetical protein